MNMVHANDYIHSWEADNLNKLVERANSHFGMNVFEVMNADEDSCFVKVFAFGEEEPNTYNDYSSVYSFFCGVCLTAASLKK